MELRRAIGERNGIDHDVCVSLSFQRVGLESQQIPSQGAGSAGGEGTIAVDGNCRGEV